MIWTAAEVIGKLTIILLIAVVVFAMGFDTGNAYGRCEAKESIAVRGPEGKYICVKEVK